MSSSLSIINPTSSREIASLGDIDNIRKLIPKSKKMFLVHTETKKTRRVKYSNGTWSTHVQTSSETFATNNI